MRLTAHIRRAIVDAILADIPDSDIEDRFEQALNDMIMEQLPPAVAAIYANPTTRHYIAKDAWHHFGLFMGRHIPRSVEVPADFEERHAKLYAAKRAEDEARGELGAKVRAVVHSCSTSKQFLDRLPEFAKYLPEEAARTPNLPAIANLTADLVKAGWPKNRSPVPVV